jgi:uncharacterized protein
LTPLSSFAIVFDDEGDNPADRRAPARPPRAARRQIALPLRAPPDRQDVPHPAHPARSARVRLLDSATFLTLSHHPGRIAEETTERDRIVVIDEIQRLPDLLNEVHRLIESRGTRFLLTGSSARKLRRGGVNLLGGRARTKRLHPLTSHELGDRFDLQRAVSRGLLPSIYFSDDPRADLEAYAGTYLREEVVAEGATRNVPAFSRFLRVAARANATIVNFTHR